jgi:hypothetical protein
MAWLSENWLYLLLFLGVFFLMRRGGMGCGMGSHRSRHGQPPADASAVNDGQAPRHGHRGC